MRSKPFFSPKPVTGLVKRDDNGSWTLVIVVENFESEFAAALAGSVCMGELNDEYGDGRVIDCSRES